MKKKVVKNSNFFGVKGVDLVEARYSSTIKLRNIAKDIEKHRLGCGIDIFSQLIGRSKSWCSNFFNATTEVKGVYPEDLKRLFAIEYNCVLFENKQEQMEGLLKDAIDSNICAAEASLDKIFKTIEFIDENGSYRKRYKIPKEIFFGEEMPLPGKIYARNSKRGTYIFKESEFVQYDKMLHSELKEKYSDEEIIRLKSKEISDYITMIQVNDNDYETPTFPEESETLARVEKYISNRMVSILNKDPISCLSDYWLFATYYKYCRITIHDQLYELLKKWYGIEKDKEIDWETLFNVFQMDKSESKKYKSGEIYFLNDTNRPISKSNLPVMYMKYDWNSKKALKERKIADAKENKLALIDLYMLIYNKMLCNEYGKKEAFEKTCARLHYNNYDILFDRLDILYLPEDKSSSVDKKYIDFLKQLRDLFAQFEDAEKNPELALFYKNFNPNQFMFLRTIAVDFSFIEKLSMYNVLELNEQISRIVDVYKKENLL